MNAVDLLAFLANHLWQSTIFAAVAAALTLALKQNHAQIRYGLWVTASIKFLVPLSLLAGIGSQFHWIRHAPVARPSAVVALATYEQWNEPFTQPDTASMATPAAMPSAPNWTRFWPTLLLVLWFAGCVVVATSSYRRWRLVAELVREAVPLSEGREAEVMRRLQRGRGLSRPISMVASTSMIEPGLFGIIRTVLILPIGIGEHVDNLQLEAILDHELSHARRRDNLWATIHMIAEAVFWFYPLLWWLGSRLVDERERACDEDVLRRGCKPHVYAQAMVEICKWCLASPVKCVSGVTGSDLNKRIETIMKNGIVRKLDLGKKFLLASVGMVAIAGPIAVGLLNAPPTRAQFRAIPKWEVASIKPCTLSFGNIITVNGPRGGGLGGPDPGRLSLRCDTLANTIRMAYINSFARQATGEFANGRQYFFPLDVPISGGPAWINSDLYQITAKAEGTPGQDMMRGPMLQALLEDRFKLKIHRETKDVPAFALTVAKGGLKLPHSQDGVSCYMEQPPVEKLRAMIAAGQKPLLLCGRSNGSMVGPNRTENLPGISLDRFAQWLSEIVGRPVIDKTGTTGLFDLHLEFAPDETTPGFRVTVIGGVTYDGEVPPLPPDAPAEVVANRQKQEAQQALHASDPARPTFFTALQEQLGLKLDSTRGPGEFFIIDRVERPTPN